jgi:uncharacterized protein
MRESFSYPRLEKTRDSQKSNKATAAMKRNEPGEAQARRLGPPFEKEKSMEQSPLLEGVTSGSFGRIIMARMPIGVDLLDAIYEAIQRENIRKGLILMGIGALSKATFRNLKIFPAEYPITAKDRIYFEVEKPLEIVSLTGYIVPLLNGQPHVHAHLAASTVTGDTISTYGGHLERGAITHVKAAVAIGELEGMEMRKHWVDERKTEDLWLGSMA